MQDGTEQHRDGANAGGGAHRIGWRIASRHCSGVAMYRWIHETKHRYYQVHLTQDLFGEWTLIRVWGGLGSHRGGMKSTGVASYADGWRRSGRSPSAGSSGVISAPTTERAAPPIEDGKRGVGCVGAGPEPAPDRTSLTG